MEVVFCQSDWRRSFLSSRALRPRWLLRSPGVPLRLARGGRCRQPGAPGRAVPHVSALPASCTLGRVLSADIPIPAQPQRGEGLRDPCFFKKW